MNLFGLDEQLIDFCAPVLVLKGFDYGFSFFLNLRCEFAILILINGESVTKVLRLYDIGR